MHLVSKKSVFLVCLMAIVFTTMAGLLVDQSRADALTSRETDTQRVQGLSSSVYSENSSLFISLNKPVVLSERSELALANREAFLGIGCSTLGPVKLEGACRATVDTVDTVVETIKDIPGMIQKVITEFSYRVIGGLVGWAGNGVVSLVAGQREECMTGGGAQDAGDTAACEARIAKDYIPFGSDFQAQSQAAFAATNDKQIERYETLVGNTSNTDLKAEYQGILDDLKEAKSINKPDENGVFYVAKSPIATEAFDREYEKYVLIAIMLMVPMLLAAALQSVITAKPFLLFKSVVLMVPVSFLAIAIAPRVVRQLMIIIDGFCAIVLRDTQADMQGFFASPQVAVGAGATAVLTLLPFLIVALVFAFAAMLVWFVLSMREASVALISIFLPIAFAASIWPALSKWALRAIKLLVAAIISKLFIVGAIALGIGVFSGSTTTTPTGGASLSFSHLIYGSTIFFIAAFSPHLVMKFFDEIGDAINAAGGTGALQRGLSAAGNTNGLRSLVGGAGIAGALKSKMSGGTSPSSGGGGGGGSPALLAAANAGKSEASKPGGSNMGDIGKAASKGSMGTAGSTGADDARGAASAIRGAGGSKEDVFNGATAAAEARAKHELGPGASTDAIAERAGQYVAEGAAQETGTSYAQGASLGRASAAGLGGSKKAVKSAGAAMQKQARSSGRWNAVASVAKGVASPMWGINHARKSHK